MTIQLPHNLGVCQKTVGNSAGNFYLGDEKTKNSILDSDANKMTD